MSKKANWYSQGKLTVTQLNDPTYPDCYETSVTSSEASSIGLPAQHWNIKYFRLGKTGGYGTQIALPVGYRGNGVLQLRISTETAFEAWSDPVATATPPQEFALPLAAGFLENQPCQYRKNQFGEVQVYFKAVNPAGISAGQVGIATLPVGFRPTVNTHSVCSSSDFNNTFYVFWALTDGNISVIVHTNSPPNPYAGFAGTISFLAAQ